MSHPTFNALTDRGILQEKLNPIIEKCKEIICEGFDQLYVKSYNNGVEIIRRNIGISYTCTITTEYDLHSDTFRNFALLRWNVDVPINMKGYIGDTPRKSISSPAYRADLLEAKDIKVSDFKLTDCPYSMDQIVLVHLFDAYLEYLDSSKIGTSYQFDPSNPEECFQVLIQNFKVAYFCNEVLNSLFPTVKILTRDPILTETRNEIITVFRALRLGVGQSSGNSSKMYKDMVYAITYTEPLYYVTNDLHRKFIIAVLQSLQFLPRGGIAHHLREVIELIESRILSMHDGNPYVYIYEDNEGIVIRPVPNIKLAGIGPLCFLKKNGQYVKSATNVRLMKRANIAYSLDFQSD